jgi:hypothetical protein
MLPRDDLRQVWMTYLVGFLGLLTVAIVVYLMFRQTPP